MSVIDLRRWLMVFSADMNVHHESREYNVRDQAYDWHEFGQRNGTERSLVRRGIRVRPDGQ